MPRFMIAMDEQTRDELLKWAAEECRAPSDQAAWVLKQAVQARLNHEEALRRLKGDSVAETERGG